MIVDTHVHVISSDQKKYPLQSPPSDVYKPHAGAFFLEAPVTVEQLIQSMAEAGVDRTILVQPISGYYYDNSYAADSGRLHSRQFVSVCIIDMLDKGAAERLKYWIKERGMSGMRVSAGGQLEVSWLDDPRTFPVWEMAASLRIPVCVQTSFKQLPE